MSTGRVSELMAAIVEWALANGVEGAHSRPGLWHGVTAADEHEAALAVALNPHMEEVDDVPPASARVMPADHKGKIAFAVIGPFDGSMIGFSEDRLIAHFRAAIKAAAKARVNNAVGGLS